MLLITKGLIGIYLHKLSSNGTASDHAVSTFTSIITEKCMANIRALFNRAQRAYPIKDIIF